jgi:hypothetical protein
MRPWSLRGEFDDNFPQLLQVFCDSTTSVPDNSRKSQLLEMLANTILLVRLLNSSCIMLLASAKVAHVERIFLL